MINEEVAKSYGLDAADLEDAIKAVMPVKVKIEEK